MQKTVYGRRPARSAFVVSDIFVESSPSKTPVTLTTPDENKPDDTVLEASKALQSLNIKDTDSGSSLPKPRRRALSRRDANSRPSSRQSNGEEAVDRTKAVEQKQKEEKDRLHINRSKRQRPAKNAEHMLEGTTSESPIEEDEEQCNSYVQRLVALTNEQKVPLRFETWSDSLTPHFKVSKIAEASYSEVYRLSLLEEHPSLTSADESVLKLIAIKPQKKDTELKKSKAQQKREEDMSSIEDIVSEVRLLKRMTEVPGFTNYRALHILEGRPSKPFVQAWKEWNKARRKGEKSEFPDPSRKANYEETQYWAVIEMQDAGTDVERLLEEASERNGGEECDVLGITSIWATWDIFWQTVLAVAKGESEAKFEHRDLHLGNICVRKRDSVGDRTFSKASMDRKLGFTNLEATIIDYTLSRADMSTDLFSRLKSSQSSPSHSTPRSISSFTSYGTEVAYNPLQRQPKVFEGDAEADYQYEIYRYMRTIVEADFSADDDTWKLYQPKTNLLWLHFVLHKFCETVDWSLEEQTLSKTAIFPKVQELEEVLEQVEDLLSIERLLGEEDCLLSSATELVAIALEQGWLNHEDIDC